MFETFRIAGHYKSEPPPNQETIIRYMFETQPLEFDPGSKYAYSNFGYCILGRVIEKASGKRYENFVREEVLKSLGIEDMRIGGSLLSQPAKGEVRYFDQGGTTRGVAGKALNKQVPRPYGGFSLETLDSHGGWIASAPDLVRFITAFDRPASLGIRNKKLLMEMFAPPDGKRADRFYGFGWDIVVVEPRSGVQFFPCRLASRHIDAARSSLRRHRLGHPLQYPRRSRRQRATRRLDRLPASQSRRRRENMAGTRFVQEITVTEQSREYSLGRFLRLRGEPRQGTADDRRDADRADRERSQRLVGHGAAKGLDRTSRYK